MISFDSSDKHLEVHEKHPNVQDPYNVTEKEKCNGALRTH